MSKELEKHSSSISSTSNDLDENIDLETSQSDIQIDGSN